MENTKLKTVDGQVKDCIVWLITVFSLTKLSEKREKILKRILNLTLNLLITSDMNFWSQLPRFWTLPVFPNLTIKFAIGDKMFL